MKQDVILDKHFETLDVKYVIMCLGANDAARLNADLTQSEN